MFQFLNAINIYRLGSIRQKHFSKLLINGEEDMKAHFLAGKDTDKKIITK